MFDLHVEAKLFGSLLKVSLLHLGGTKEGGVGGAKPQLEPLLSCANTLS